MLSRKLGFLLTWYSLLSLEDRPVYRMHIAEGQLTIIVISSFVLVASTSVLRIRRLAEHDDCLYVMCLGEHVEGRDALDAVAACDYFSEVACQRGGVA